MSGKGNARMVGFKYEGKKPRTLAINPGRKDAIDFRKIEEDVNRVAKKLFKESQLLDLK